mgnify:CR=1 FL=1
MGRLNGVVDDRGKYIYITADEMQKVTDFIKQQGRVNMAALAKASNRLINLNTVDSSSGEDLTLNEGDFYDKSSNPDSS